MEKTVKKTVTLRCHKIIKYALYRLVADYFKYVYGDINTAKEFL